jgi:hypothetical protein
VATLWPMTTSEKKRAAPAATKEAPPPVKRRKDDVSRKEEVIKVRVTIEQKTTLTEAASRDGLEVSTWLRSLGLRAAAGSSPS